MFSGLTLVTGSQLIVEAHYFERRTMGQCTHGSLDRLQIVSVGNLRLQTTRRRNKLWRRNEHQITEKQIICESKIKLPTLFLLCKFSIFV